MQIKAIGNRIPFIVGNVRVVCFEITKNIWFSNVSETMSNVTGVSRGSQYRSKQRKIPRRLRPGTQKESTAFWNNAFSPLAESPWTRWRVTRVMVPRSDIRPPRRGGVPRRIRECPAKERRSSNAYNIAMYFGRYRGILTMSWSFSWNIFRKPLCRPDTKHSPLR